MVLFLLGEGERSKGGKYRKDNGSSLDLACASLVELLGKAKSRLWKTSRFVVLRLTKGDSNILDIVSQSSTGLGIRGTR